MPNGGRDLRIGRERRMLGSDPRLAPEFAPTRHTCGSTTRRASCGQDGRDREERDRCGRQVSAVRLYELARSIAVALAERGKRQPDHLTGVGFRDLVFFFFKQKTAYEM